MPVQSLRIKQLGPFQNVELQFDRQVNVFIGPNNCGKSTVLMSLAEAIVFPFMAPPRLYRPNKKPQLKIMPWGEAQAITRNLPWIVGHEDVALMKRLGYTGFVPALRENTGFRPRSPMGEGTIEPRRIRDVRGTGMSVLQSDDRALRDEQRGIPMELYRYMKVGELQKLKLSKADQAELARRRPWTSDPSRVTDHTVVAKMVELDYRAYRKGDRRFRQVVEVMAGIASEIMTGFPLDFQGIEENERGLYPQFGTPDGSLPLDKLSQGTQSVVQWLSHLVLGMGEYYDFPSDLTTRPAVFIIDEIDAHMHPEWQRRIVPTIVKNLPNCQLFVSTHSPLILSGLAKGQVHLLSRDDRGRVVVSTNEEDIVGWSVDETMRWLMEMRGTFDSETERAATELMRLRDKTSLTDTERTQLETLREEIHDRLVRTKKAATKSKQVQRQA